MIKFTPVKQSSVLILDVEIFVNTDVDYVTLDSDGEVSAWSNCRKPSCGTLGYWKHHWLDRDVSPVRLGDFTRDDDKSFEPLCIEV